MGLGAALGQLITGNSDKVIDGFKDIITNLFTNNDERAKDLAVLQATLLAKQSAAELQAKVEEQYLADAANLREQAKIEIQNADWFVRRSRPAAVWVGTTILAFNYVLRPLILTIIRFWDSTVTFDPMPLPDAFWEVWTVLVVGYGILRTIDKKTTAAGSSGP